VPPGVGIGVFTAVPDSDVESGSALFYGAGGAAGLHYSGGCIFSDWAPFSGNALTDGAIFRYLHKLIWTFL
jgi:hypothetical protein